MNSAVAKITWQRFRDIGLFAFGLFVGYHEIVIEPLIRPEGLIFAAALLGLPFALRQDEKR